MAYKPFKMKGHTLPGINQRSEGNTDLPDGRSGSSPFQQAPGQQSHLDADFVKSQGYEFRDADGNVLDLNKVHISPKDWKTNPKIVKYVSMEESKKEESSDKKKEKSPANPKSPNKWVQFIPMIAGAVGSMMKKDKE